MKLIIFFIPSIYLILRTLFWRQKPLSLRVLMIFILFIISMTHVIQEMFFKSLSGPDMSSKLLLLQIWLYVAMLFAFLLVATRDAIKFSTYLLKKFKSKKDKTSEFSQDRRIFLQNCSKTALSASAIPITSLSLSSVGLMNGCEIPKINRMTLVKPNLSNDLDGFKIAHLTDIHIGPLTSIDWARKVVELTNAEKPDIICLTGDLTDGQLDYQIPGSGTKKEAFQEFSKLSARFGVFGCTGNHEYYSDFKGWMKEYEQAKIEMLFNSHCTIYINSTQLVLIGLDDTGGWRVVRSKNTMQKIFDKIENVSNDAFRILLEHRPNRAQLNAQYEVDLQLSGHTHGGQCIGMDRLVANSNAGFVRGWYSIEDMKLYVSNGVGLWSGFPIRFGVPAEIAIITLR